MKILNIVRVQSHLFIPIALMVSEYYKNVGESAVICLPKGLADKIKRLKLVYGIDYIEENDVTNIEGFGDFDELNLVFHHYSGALSNCKDIISGFDSEKFKISISYYADGFVNVFLDVDYVYNLVVKKLDLKQRHAFSFDKTMDFFRTKLQGVEHLEISSELLSKIFDKYGFSDFFSEVNKVFSQKLNERFIVLVMRPWGSEIFHGGNYAFVNGGKDLADVVTSIFEALQVDTGNPVNVLYRRDNRDKAVMEDFEDSFFSKHDSIQFFEVDRFIPDWLTLDFFLIYFSKFISKNLELITFDSSTSLSLMPLKIGVKHVFGAPAKSTDLVKKNQEMTNIFTNKVNISKAHILNSISNNLYEHVEGVPNGMAVYTLKG